MERLALLVRWTTRRTNVVDYHWKNFSTISSTEQRHRHRQGTFLPKKYYLDSSAFLNSTTVRHLSDEFRKVKDVGFRKVKSGTSSAIVQETQEKSLSLDPSWVNGKKKGKGKLGKAQRDRRKDFDKETEENISLNLLFMKYPELQKLPQEYLTIYIDFMSTHGFRSHQSAEMVLISPPLLRSHPTIIPRTLEAWRSVGYEFDDIAHLLTQHPQLTEISATRLTNRYSFLGKYLTRQESLRAIEGSTEVILDSKEVLESKFVFLIEEMSHQTALIVNSKTLSFSLSHIQCRHEFLIRAGLFVPVPQNKLHKKAYTINPRVARPNYFSPHDIVCTNDRQFLKNCTDGALTLNELAAFEEAYAKELEAEAYFGEEDEDLPDLDEEEYPEVQVFSPAARGRASNSSAFFNPKDTADFYY